MEEHRQWAHKVLCLLGKSIWRKDKEDVNGKVGIYLQKGKPIEHMGIWVELLGLIENSFDKTQNFQFLNLTRELEPPGTLSNDMTYDFDFKNVEKAYESYQGIQCALKYLIRVTIWRNYGEIKQEELFLV